MANLVLTNKGIENISAKEIEQLGGTITETAPGMIIMECQDPDKITYMGRTFNRTIEILADFRFQDKEEITSHIPEAQVTESFAVECEREGEHEFTSFEIAQAIDKRIKEQTRAEVDHKKPRTKFFALISGNRCIFGKDNAGIDLGKRDYRIFLGREALRGNIAAALLKIAEFENGQTLLDPFSKHGIIPIEAALIATNTSVNKYIKDKLSCKNDLSKYDKPQESKSKILCVDPDFPHINAAKKNAKIAGVVKQIEFSRQDTEWLDAKYPPASIDKIVTMPQNYKEFFNQARTLLKRNGRIVLCLKKDDIEHAGFKRINETKIMQGKEPLTIIVLERD